MPRTRSLAAHLRRAVLRDGGLDLERHRRAAAARAGVGAAHARADGVAARVAVGEVCEAFACARIRARMRAWGLHRIVSVND